MLTKNKIENRNSWFSSHAIAAAMVALLVAGCAASGFAEQPQPKAFATVGDAAGSGPAYEKSLGPETKALAPEIHAKPSGKGHRAEASQTNQVSKEDWMIRCLQNDACHTRARSPDEWDERFGLVDVFMGD